MRFYLIDALRGIAALWVVLFHAYEGGHIDRLAKMMPNAWSYLIFEMGTAGVPIFFVISGFVIAHSVNKDRVDSNYLMKFAIRRSVRLDPPYWGSIIFALSMVWVSTMVKNEPMEWPSLSTMIAHLTYTQGLLSIPHINDVYWTLCLEIQFYLVFCLLLVFVQRIERHFKSAFHSVFFCAGLISLLWPTCILIENVHPGLFLPHWHAFLLGIFGYWSWKKRISSVFFYAYAATILLPSCAAQSSFSIAASLTAIFVHESAKYGYIAAANWRWVQFLGTISYSLYLTHNPITGASYYIIYRFLGNSELVQLFAFVSSTVACLGFAYLFWWFFESWSIPLSKKISLHKKVKKVKEVKEMTEVIV